MPEAAFAGGPLGRGIASCSGRFDGRVPSRFSSIRMPTFELQFPAEEIVALAGRFGHSEDAHHLAAGAAARARGHYTREEFIEVCAWKTARSRSKVASNAESAVVQATGRALAAADETTRTSTLLELEGVGAPTASTLLYCASSSSRESKVIAPISGGMLGVRRENASLRASRWRSWWESWVRARAASAMHRSSQSSFYCCRSLRMRGCSRLLG